MSLSIYWWYSVQAIQTDSYGADTRLFLWIEGQDDHTKHSRTRSTHGAVHTGFRSMANMIDPSVGSDHAMIHSLCLSGLWKRGFCFCPQEVTRFPAVHCDGTRDTGDGTRVCSGRPESRVPFRVQRESGVPMLHLVACKRRSQFHGLRRQSSCWPSDESFCCWRESSVPRAMERTNK
jgi:hypothetical protein